MKVGKLKYQDFLRRMKLIGGQSITLGVAKQNTGPTQIKYKLHLFCNTICQQKPYFHFCRYNDIESTTHAQCT